MATEDPKNLLAKLLATSIDFPFGDPSSTPTTLFLVFYQKGKKKRKKKP